MEKVQLDGRALIADVQFSASDWTRYPEVDSYSQCINYSVSSSYQLYDKRFNIDVFEILNDWMSFISDINPSSEIPIKTTN